MIGLLLALALSREPQLEMGPPSYCSPIFFRRATEKPAPIRGYLWVEHDYGLQSKYGFPDTGWALYRTTASPPNNKAVYKQLGVSGAELWGLGRAADTDYVP